uniref:Homing endonuclease LAGLIDADG domain-containing protein n=1 Tax=Orbilia brochopaga TaxID=3140254 RepID=A0A481ZQ79_9PEZI|nr:hypothetical protein [Drechslerella brochopaga]QBL02528.1 hypothetical protein [Drechslerella brochopaga]
MRLISTFLLAKIIKINEAAPLLKAALLHRSALCAREACFHLSIGKNSKYKIGYYVNPGFSIGLHKKILSLLEKYNHILEALVLLVNKQKILFNLEFFLSKI